MNEEGREYLYHRGLDDDTIAYFHLGMNIRQTAITIPLIYTANNNKHCPGIKMRTLPRFVGNNRSSYVSFTGSMNKGIFNFDLLDFGRNHQTFGIIANSLFDVMLLWKYKYPVIGPFAGEAVWDQKWGEYINWDYIINIGDRDKPKASGEHPGYQYMLKRAMMLDGSAASKIINTLPPEPYGDISDMFDKVGERAIYQFISDTLEGLEE
jgi:hypothetical protein